MTLSVTTDYARALGCPEEDLRRIADAGFSHIHWCHQWNTDFLYCDAEIEQIGAWMKEFGLALTDLHASDGVEKRWVSPREYERVAGVELVANRIAMTARLGGDVIIMHLGRESEEDAPKGVFWTQLWKSLDALEPIAQKHGVRIAVENGEFPAIRKVLARYGPDYVGLCYDCGHGNLIEDGLDQADALKDRLISVHLHDNDGTGDRHDILFTGTVDWKRLATILAASAYKKPVSMEVSIHNGAFDLDDEAAFLAKTFETGTEFSEMIALNRDSHRLFGSQVSSESDVHRAPQIKGDCPYLKVGFGEADITPAKPVLLRGYYHDRLSTGVNDPLAARAMAVSDGETAVVLCVLDLVYLNPQVTIAIREAVEERCGLAQDHLLLSCVHTHTGPDLEKEPAYTETLPENVAAAVDAALQALAPVTLSVAMGKEETLAYIRRYRMKDGSVRTNPGILNPDVVEALDTPDYTLAAVTASGDGVEGGLVHYGLHCDTVGGNLISADWTHYLRERMRKELGGDLALLTPIGTAGDVNHWNVFKPVTSRGFEETARIGRTLGEAALKALAQAEPLEPGPVRGARAMFEAALRYPSDEELAEARRVWEQPAPEDKDFTMDRVEALRRIRVAELGRTINLDVTVLAFGDMALVGMPCELFTALGREIKARSPFKYTLPISLADGCIGYVGTRQAFDEGGYEMTSTLLAPGMGDKMVDRAVELLEKLRGGRKK
jgi:sugar phosphate isomerase/epimerase